MFVVAIAGITAAFAVPSWLQMQADARARTAARTVANAFEYARNQAIYRTLLEGGVDIALRRGHLRLSPHFYNTPDDIDRALAALQRARSD